MCMTDAVQHPERPSHDVRHVRVVTRESMVGSTWRCLGEMRVDTWHSTGGPLCSFDADNMALPGSALLNSSAQKR